MNIFNQDFQDFIQSLNKHGVEYILVGGYAVILRGYSRSTGDMDIWINKTDLNFNKLVPALAEFGLPIEAVPKEKFFSEQYDVFSIGLPPRAIELMTVVKGVDFSDAFQSSTVEQIDDIQIRVIHLKNLIQAKKAAGRYKDLNDIENLPSIEE
jgi:predicted nucleotidyltransferase